MQRAMLKHTRVRFEGCILLQHEDSLVNRYNKAPMPVVSAFIYRIMKWTPYIAESSLAIWSLLCMTLLLHGHTDGSKALYAYGERLKCLVNPLSYGSHTDSVPLSPHLVR